MSIATSWSFSALRDYERCPFVIQLKANKAPRPEEEENRGTILHRYAEQYIKGEIDNLPAGLKKFDTEFERLREVYPTGRLSVEQSWGFDALWQPVDWFAKDIQLRVQIDVLERLEEEPDTALVLDWKSGKSWGNEIMHAQQLQLYAIATMMKFPDIHHVVAQDYYLDEGKVKKKAFHRDEKFDLLFEKWSERAEKMLTDDEPRARPNRMNCRFCNYGVTKGSGACDFAVPWEA